MSKVNESPSQNTRKSSSSWSKSLFGNIGDEIQTIILYSIVPSLMISLLTFMELNVRAVIVSIHVLVFLLMVKSEDDDIANTTISYLTIRWGIITSIFFASIHAQQYLYTTFNFKPPFFLMTQSWTTWLIQLGIEYLNMIYVLSRCRIIFYACIHFAFILILIVTLFA